MIREMLRPKKEKDKGPCCAGRPTCSHRPRPATFATTTNWYVFAGTQLHHASAGASPPTTTTAGGSITVTGPGKGDDGQDLVVSATTDKAVQHQVKRIFYLFPDRLRGGKLPVGALYHDSVGHHCGCLLYLRGAGKC